MPSIIGRLNYWFQVFLNFGPIWLALYAIVSVWANQLTFCWTQLITPAGLRFGLIDQAPDYPGLGIALLVISAFLKIAWFAPYVQMGMFTYRRDRGWRAPQSCKNIMQADEDAFSVAPPRTPNDILYEDNRRPRYCPKGCDFRLSDRVYHCTDLDICLPVYDHFCPFLQCVVYLRTIKLYLFVLIFLPVDCLMSVALSIFTLAKFEEVVVPHVCMVMLGALMIIFVTYAWTYDKFWLLAGRNCTAPEKGNNREIILAFRYKNRETRRDMLHLERFVGRHPWDLGTWENLHQVLGRHWWQWFLFWVLPERVARYGRFGVCDLPFADWVVDYSKWLTSSRERSNDFNATIPPHLGQEGSSSRRQDQRSSGSSVQTRTSEARQVNRSSQHSASHVEAPTRPPPPPPILTLASQPFSAAQRGRNTTWGRYGFHSSTSEETASPAPPTRPDAAAAAPPGRPPPAVPPPTAPQPRPTRAAPAPPSRLHLDYGRYRFPSSDSQ